MGASSVSLLESACGERPRLLPRVMAGIVAVSAAFVIARMSQ
jgi:hypothetical protein